MTGPLLRKTIDELTIDDERSFRHVGIYADLKEVLRRAGYAFRILPSTHAGRWDDALLLNLAFWDARSAGDVLTDERIDADVVAHAAWHWLASRAFTRSEGESPTVDALLFGEAVASAFDLYMIGRLLGHAPDAQLLATQVPAMLDVAEAAGISEEAFDGLLNGVADDPDRAFEDLRQLLFDVCTALMACATPDDAFVALSPFAEHRFAPILHRFELANWTLYARAHGRPSRAGERDPAVRAFDAQLRAQAAPVDWLASQWIAPLLGDEGASVSARPGRAR